jgi:hypothetical protein
LPHLCGSKLRTALERLKDHTMVNRCSMAGSCARSACSS